MLAAAWLMLRGRFGRSLRAVRDSELAAASSGVNLARYKTLAFGISAFYAGVAGSLLAIATTFVNPDTFPIALSIFLLVGVVVGGLGSLWPLVFGAIFIHFMQIEWAQRVESVIPNWLPLLGDIDTDAAGRSGGGLRRDPDPDHAASPRWRGGPPRHPQGACDPRLPSRSLGLDQELLYRCVDRTVARHARARGATRPAQRASRTPGSRDKTILLGGTAPLSGPASPARRSPAARARTSVRERPRRRQRPHDRLQGRRRRLGTRRRRCRRRAQLVEQDGVFAIVNAPGPSRTRRCAPYLNAAKVPQLFVDSGATTFGRDYRRYPWTIGFRPSYQRRGLDLRQATSARTRPGAKIAVLFQNDVLRHGPARRASSRASPRSKARVVAAQPSRRPLPTCRDSDREPEGLRRERARALRDAAAAARATCSPTGSAGGR